MPQINSKPDRNMPVIHQHRYYSPIVESEFEFVSLIYIYIRIFLRYGVLRVTIRGC